MSSSRKQARKGRTPEPDEAPGILSIDVGGSGVKGAVLGPDGEMRTSRHRIKTPGVCTRDALMKAILEVASQFEGYDRVSVGFPGVVKNGVIITAPNLGTEALAGFDLAGGLSEELGRPAKVINDADMQGLGAIRGVGIEMVITLGTGFGSALFQDGRLAPHLELGHHPFRKGETYDEQLGKRGLTKVGKKRWNRRVRRAIKLLRVLTNFDRLFIGGGNNSKIDFKLDPDLEIVPNEYGVRGGAWLWYERPSPVHDGDGEGTGEDE